MNPAQSSLFQSQHPKSDQAARRYQLRMAAGAYRCLICEIGRRQPESGGILLGPIGSEDITEFFFDAGADCSGSTYTPDHNLLNRMLKEQWIPNQLDMKGFVHSHPGTLDLLSAGDLAYIKRLLARNSDMSVFAAPIVLPSQYRFCPLVVAREPFHVHKADLVLF